MFRVQERHFPRFPRWASRLYDFLTQAQIVQLQTDQIARFLCSQMNKGKLLDIGSGPGRLLLRLHALNPVLDLYGLDISPAMIGRASENLAGMPTWLMVGSIEHAPFEDEMFDLVTCTGSFYLWEHPRECLNEIWRILKLPGRACLFEIRGDVDLKDLKRTLRHQLRRESLWRRAVAPFPIRKAISQCYSFEALSALLKDTSFRTSTSIEPIELAGLPMWYLVKLQKM
jgi:ubiquinone/menaquinone biosynthesis C-methylase UbiE